MASGNSILSASGIGSGEGNATCGDILISGGTVTAEGECDAAGIGTVTIGGKVGPVSESPFVYKP